MLSGINSFHLSIAYELLVYCTDIVDAAQNSTRCTISLKAKHIRYFNRKYTQMQTLISIITAQKAFQMIAVPLLTSYLLFMLFTIIEYFGLVICPSPRSFGRTSNPEEHGRSLKLTQEQRVDTSLS